MSVLDSQALIAGLRAEPAMVRVAGLLRADQGPPLMSTLSVGEVMDVLVRAGAARSEQVAETIASLVEAGLTIVPVDGEIGRLGGLLRARHWDRDRRPVSLADCIVLATGMVHGEAVATSDRSLIAAARAEGHPVIPLPDSTGSLPA
jgi:predicted nucleic acid-binding protein